MLAVKILEEYLSFGKKDYLLPLDGNWKKVKREDIHCLKGTYCFRDYLDKRYKSPGSKNKILLELERFFEKKITIHASSSGEFLSNPVIKKWDKFKEIRNAGTIRKAIDKKILKRIKEILMEDNFNFTKEKDSKNGVWNPSRSIMMYLMLTYPLRSIQVRLLDSGRENKNEGLLQKRYFSGVSKVKRDSLYINTNKNSSGYYIPWVSDETKKILNIQYDWIKEYGKDIVVYKEYKNKETKKINPLFLTWDKMIVSRESLMKLWKDLCIELKRRDGIEVDSDLHTLRVSLITHGMDEIGDLKFIGDNLSGQENTEMVNHYFRVENLQDLIKEKEDSLENILEFKKLKEIEYDK